MGIKEINNKQYIFCPWRKKYVRLTPEEWVRQQFLHQLVEQYGFPESLIAVEVQLLTRKRTDAVVYTRELTPLILIEFKAENVPLTGQVLDQIAVYNRQFNVPYLILNNGLQTIMGHIDNNAIQFMDAIPHWTELIQ